MKVIITIDCDNSAFNDESELVRVVQTAANKIDRSMPLDTMVTYSLFDINGNKCGHIKVIDD